MSVETMFSNGPRKPKKDDQEVIKVKRSDIVDKDSRALATQENEDTLAREAWAWIRDTVDFTDRKIRWYVVFPAVVQTILYIVAEVFGIEEILWGLIAFLFATRIAIVLSWPTFLTALSLAPGVQGRIVPITLLAEFVFELTLLLVALAIPFHKLGFTWGIVPFLCFIGALAILAMHSIANRTLPKNIFSRIQKGFILVVLVSMVVALVSGRF